MHVQTMANFQSDLTRLSVCLSTKNDIISGSSLPQLSDHYIFEILQDLIVAEIKW